MKKLKYIFGAIILLTLVHVWTISKVDAVTILLTNSTDTLTTFRTNVNTSLTNLNTGLTTTTINGVSGPTFTFSIVSTSSDSSITTSSANLFLNLLRYSSSSDITITSTGTIVFASHNISQFTNDVPYLTGTKVDSLNSLTGAVIATGTAGQITVASSGQTLTFAIPNPMTQNVSSTNISGTNTSSTRLGITGTAGAGYITLIAQSSNPASPAAGTLLIHSATTQGFTRMEQDNEAATNLVYGRDSVFIAKNTSGVTINPGQPVYVSGSTGNVPNVALAQANSTSTLPNLGLALDSIGNNNFGQIMTWGIISSINTSAYNSGDTLYVSPTASGTVTSTRPTTPNFVSKAAVVLVSGVGNGSILVETAPFIGNAETGSSYAGVYRLTGSFAASGTLTVTGTSTFQNGISIPTIINSVLATDANGKVIATTTGAGTPAGTTNDVQLNIGNSFGSDTGYLTHVSSTHSLRIGTSSNFSSGTLASSSFYALAVSGNILTGGSSTSVSVSGGATASSTSFAYTGATSTFTFPNGVATATVSLIGAGGGTAGGGAAGKGGYAIGIITVTSSPYYYCIGGLGANNAGANGGVGGFCGGANGGSSGSNGGGGGGGRTTWSLSPTVISSTSVMTAAGGGGGSNDTGGAGGGLTGGDGDSSGAPDGKGGTPTAGGANGTSDGSPGVAGTANTGGAGGFGSAVGGGGGGGGCYGGGGGAGTTGGAGGGGGGGSSCFSAGVTGTSTGATSTLAAGAIYLSYVIAPVAPSVVGNNTAGVITLNDTESAVTLSFGGTGYKATPVCVATPSANTNIWLTSQSSSSVTFNFSTSLTSGQSLNYHCVAK